MRLREELLAKLAEIKSINRIGTQLYSKISQSIINLAAEIQRRAPDSIGFLTPYLERKFADLADLGRAKNNLQEFDAQLLVEITLINCCIDAGQIETTLAILNNDARAPQGAARELAATQMIHQLAAKQDKITAQTLFPNVIKEGRIEDLERMFKSPYFEQMTMDAFKEYLLLNGDQAVDNYEIFPGKTLRSLLEDGVPGNEDATIKDIISNYVQSHPECIPALNHNMTLNPGTLNTVCKVYHMDRSNVERIFKNGLEYERRPTGIDMAYRYDPSAHQAFDQAEKNLATMERQLRALFQNQPDLLLHAKRYIDTQKQAMPYLIKAKDPIAISQYSQQLNLVFAMGAIIKKCPTIATKLKKSGQDFDEIIVNESRSVVLLAEQIRALSLEDPAKAQAIHVALTEVLNQSPEMTFDKVVQGMRTNTDENNPLGKLKTAMGTHRDWFSKIVNYFYPFDTNTMKYFKEKIQEKTHLEAKDRGIEVSDETKQTGSSFGKGGKY